MFSKAVAKAFLAINIVSFLIITTIILIAMLSVPPPPNIGPSAQAGAILFYLTGFLLLVVNTIVHGVVALAGAFLAELERIRRAVEDIKAWGRP